MTRDEAIKKYNKMMELIKKVPSENHINKSVMRSTTMHLLDNYLLNCKNNDFKKDL